MILVILPIYVKLPLELAVAREQTRWQIEVAVDRERWLRAIEVEVGRELTRRREVQPKREPPQHALDRGGTRGFSTLPKAGVIGA